MSALTSFEEVTLKKIISAAVSALFLTAYAVHADPAGDLLDQIDELDQTEIKSVDGHLFMGWMQMDEADPDFVVYVNDRRYQATLDDGRGTTKRAQECQKENLFDENPTTGCPITFDAEYHVEGQGGTVEISMLIWNVTFK